MSMAARPETKQIICGINSSEEALKVASNQNCRRYAVKDNKYVATTFAVRPVSDCLLRLAFEASTSTLTVNPEDDDYQVCTLLRIIMPTLKARRKSRCYLRMGLCWPSQARAM